MESLQVASEREIHEAVKVKPKMEWRPQKLRGAGNTDCVLRKTAGCGENLSALQPARSKGLENILESRVPDALIILPWARGESD